MRRAWAGERPPMRSSRSGKCLRFQQLPPAADSRPDRRLEEQNAHARLRPMTVLESLLDSDPSIRWQVLRDLVHAPAEVVAANAHGQPPRVGVPGSWRCRVRTGSGLEARAFQRGASTGAMKTKASLGSPPCQPFNCCMTSGSIQALIRSSGQWRWSEITAVGSTPASRSSVERSSRASMAGRSCWASTSVKMWTPWSSALLASSLKMEGGTARRRMAPFVRPSPPPSTCSKVC